ncbi:aminotransferase class V-fold PLP-dependent enzyme [Alteribacillus sp. YIM 98480]|uniref:aminotransferase class V-fold PLP-dependent enzyme n=1 Tax=Alteribacillus sp. YIM 98480 TaxID=2606599 RepID=UPI00131A969E|nr:aminotransferase class V-fold PLP-dependent enzyme [Alteribacillus sp. YIM 98480]
MEFQFSKYRNLFPSLNHYTQLSSCSQSAISTPVKKAVQEYMNSWEQFGMDWMGWVEAAETARKYFAELINAEVEEVAIVSSVSHAASAIATALEFSDNRNEIVTTDMDFPTIGHVWQSQQSRGASTKFISSVNDYIPIEFYDKTLSSQTLLTSIAQIAYYNGFEQDVKKITELAHSKGSYIFVDAYQSAGNVSIDVKESNVDFLTSGLQKYLLGIPGVAFLYIKKEIAEKLNPKITGWFGQDNPFLFDIKDLTYKKGAQRFDSGTAPMINCFAAKEALNLILEVGMNKIESYLKELSAFTISYAQKNSLEIKSPTDTALKGSNTAIYVENANEIEASMRRKGIIVSARRDVIRIAPHFYNSKEDITRAIDLLVETIQE